MRFLSLVLFAFFVVACNEELPISSRPCPPERVAAATEAYSACIQLIQNRSTAGANCGIDAFRTHCRASSAVRGTPNP